jgi:hypothetical protein
MTIAKPSLPTLTHGLKEWQVAVTALEQGETIVLLRKGGLREAKGQFTIAHQHILLYPTYEHQQPHLVKAQYANAIVPVASGWHPETIRLNTWATITESIQVSEAAPLAALLPFHIWNEAFAAERLKWKPSQPIEVLLLRVYRLGQPQIIPYNPVYGGCKSWLDLSEAIAQTDGFASALADSTPVLKTADYHDRCARILAIVQQGGAQ